jgi:pimeloyl-ACP methyl ester carboxylesterase
MSELEKNRSSTATAALHAEGRLFEHYGLDYRIHHVQLKNPDLRVRVLEVGQGDPVLFVPGGTGEGWAFAGLMAELKGRRMISITMPGGGLSDPVDWRTVNIRRLFPDVVLGVMDAFGLGQVPVIGNSMGGCTTFWVALEHPEWIARIVQLGCTAWLPGMRLPPFMRLLALPGLNRFVAAQMVPKSVDQAAARLKFQGSRPDDIRRMDRIGHEAAYHFFNLPTYPGTWCGLISTMATWSGPRPRYAWKADELQRITQPVLYVWGDNDPFGGLALARTIVRVLPQATLHEMRAGHLPFLDNPAECGRVIRQFL